MNIKEYVDGKTIKLDIVTILCVRPSLSGIISKRINKINYNHHTCFSIVLHARTVTWRRL